MTLPERPTPLSDDDIRIAELLQIRDRLESDPDDVEGLLWAIDEEIKEINEGFYEG